MMPVDAAGDLQRICEREPIHVPGAIQPYGALLAIPAGSRRISHASANAATLLGLPPSRLVGRDIAEVIGEEACSRLLGGGPQCEVTMQYLSQPVQGRALDMRAFRAGARICIDIEPVASAWPGDMPANALDTVLNRLSAVRTTQALFEETVEGLKWITGYDRVMVYRFASDGHGEIVAERREPGLSPFLGMHYPAADIPLQARRQYLAQPVGSVADAAYQPVLIEADDSLADAHEPLDLTHSELRSVSPIHREYMRNMQTAASLTVGLAQEGRLWGMLVCHHAVPRRASPPLRNAAGILGRVVSLVHANLVASAAAAHAGAREAALQQFVESLYADLPLARVLEDASAALLHTVDAEGAVLVTAGERIFLGRTPARAAVERALVVMHAQAGQRTAGGMLAFDDVGRRFPELDECTPRGSGVLWLPFGARDGDAIMFFRPEIEETRIWGGDPAVPHNVDSQTGKVSPRTSFAAWKQTVQGTCRPWSPADQAMASTITAVLVSAVAHRRGVAQREAEDRARLIDPQPAGPATSGLPSLLAAPAAPAAPAGPASEVDSAYESLMQFLYLAPVGLVQCGPDGTVEMVNPMSATLLMPLSPDGNMDNLFVMLSGVAPWLRQRVAAFPDRQGLICDAVRVPIARGAAEPRTLSLGVRKLDEQRLMVMLTDITLDVEREQKGLERSLHAAARIDALTKMPNRAAMWEVVTKALQRRVGRESEEFALLFINCDRFKQVNDSLGQGAGDAVLNLMAERLQSTLRQFRRRAGGEEEGRQQSGDTAGRIGGDEFVVLIDDLRSIEDAHLVANRLLGVLAKPYAVGGHRLHVGVSMGLVLRQDMPGDADAAIHDASVAMREAKRAGGNRYMLFEPAMQERASRRAALEMELRQAIALGQLFVVYQPVVDLALPRDEDNAAPPHSAGVEALVRWRHPERGLVAPLDFIGLAEECGLIGEIGEFVLFTACHQFMEWQRKLGTAAPRLMAVNLSRGQLVEPGFARQVAEILRSSGMRCDQLQLEVTESLAAQDDAVQAELGALQAMGVTLALDDFGTGYSSLSSLHQLPVTTVKIDRSFVSNSVDSAHHQVLIEATIRVARSLGMGTVAEGIETAEQCALLRRLGCDKGQGYLFSKPLPHGELLTWLVAAREALAG